MNLAFRPLRRVSCLALVLTGMIGCSSSSARRTVNDGGTDDGGDVDGGASDASDDGAGDGGVVTTLASGQKNPGGIVVNSRYVSWTTCTGSGGTLNGPGSLYALALSGGMPVALVSNTDNGGQLAIDGTSIYWGAPDDDDIVKVALGGGSPVTLASHLRSSPLTVAVDTTSVYWADGTSILKVPLAGGTPTTLASPRNLSDISQQPDLAVNASGVYATTATAVLKIPLGGGSPVTLASDQAPSSITADATSVYWTNAGDNAPPSIVKVAAAGGTPVTLSTLTMLAVPVAIAVDATSVYWIEALGGVNEVPLGGGAAVRLAAAPSQPGGIAVDSTSVYWTDTAGGNVYKTAK